MRLQQGQEVLAAACDLFSEKRYHKVSMHEIAAEAEFAIGTLYKFFQNKEDLYRTLVLEQCDRRESAIAQAIERPGDEIEKLRFYIRVKGKRWREDLPLTRLVLAERSGASFNVRAGLQQELRNRHRASLEILASIFERAIEKKRFKEMAAPFSLAFALDSFLDAFLLLQPDMPEQHSSPKDPSTILDVFLNGLMIGEPHHSEQ